MKWAPAIETHDWVVARRTIPVTFADSLTGSGIRPGTRGVVLATSHGLLSSNAQIRFNIGFGAVTVYVPTHHVRRVRRAGGIDRFAERQRRHTAMRLGALIALGAYPAAWSVWFLLGGGTLTELMLVIIESAVLGLLDFLHRLATAPARSLLLLSVLVGAGQLARGRI